MAKFSPSSFSHPTPGHLQAATRFETSVNQTAEQLRIMPSLMADLQEMVQGGDEEALQPMRKVFCTISALRLALAEYDELSRDPSKIPDMGAHAETR